MNITKGSHQQGLLSQSRYGCIPSPNMRQPDEMTRSTGSNSEILTEPGHLDKFLTHIFVSL
jgi:hypothetical protein